MKKIYIVLLLLIGIAFFLTRGNNLEFANKQNEKPSLWEFRSIDTMKYSRDPSREKLHDASFDKVIDQQVKQIAETGATHVAIGTPYDEEFLPVLRRWVAAARKYELSVWFRGNWSGWEKWFGYPGIGREEHMQKTREYILSHPDLFQDGDVFSACPECENGGPGDPRMNGDANGHKKFLIDEYTMTKDAFKKIGKDVKSNYHSMNGDVARLIMDKETTQALDGIVTIDHYVATSDKLVADIKAYAEQSGGKVILGEFGAPIPDIHGQMTEEEQAQWLKEAFQKLAMTKELVGMNYWTGVGGSTELWNGDGVPRKAAEEIKKVYRPILVRGFVKNEVGDFLSASVQNDSYGMNSNGKQGFYFPYFHENFTVEVSAEGYKSKNVVVDGKELTVVLEKNEEDLLFKLRKLLR